MKKNYFTHSWEIKQKENDKIHYRCIKCGMFFSSIFAKENLFLMKMDSCETFSNNKMIRDIIE